MATLTSGSSVTQYLSGGQFLTITTAPGAEGFIDINPAAGNGSNLNTRGSSRYGPVPLLSAQYGPYGFPVLVTIRSTTGAVTYGVTGEGLAVDPLTGNATGLVGPTGDFLVVSSAAPSNADGRPNGTIYIQTV